MKQSILRSRPAALALAACLAAMMPGCAAAGTQAAPAAASTAQAAAAAPLPGEAQPQGDTSPARPLYLLHQGLYSGSEEAFYAAYRQGAVYLGTAISMEDGVQRVLCSKDGCGHTGPDCGAYLCTVDDALDPMAALLCDGDTLYWVVGQGPEARIDESALDGSGRTLLYSGATATGPSFTGSSICQTGAYLSDGETLYWFGSETGLYRLDREDSSARQLYAAPELPGLSNGRRRYCAGIWNGKLLLASAQREDGSCEFSAVDSNGSAQEQLYTLPAALPSFYWAQGDTLYRTGGTDPTLYAVDLAGGGERAVCTGLPATDPVIGYRMIGVYDGNVILDCGVHDDSDPWNWQNTRLAVNGESGEITLLPYIVLGGDEAEAMFPNLLGYSGGTLLLYNGSEVQVRPVVQGDGSVQRQPDTVSRYALLPLQNYLQNDILTQSCTTLGRSIAG